MATTQPVRGSRRAVRWAVLAPRVALVEGLRPDNPLVQGHFLAPNFSLTAPSGVAALNAEVTRQAAMISYNDDFKLMMIIVLASLPLVLLIRVTKRPPVTAVAPSGAAAVDAHD